MSPYRVLLVDDHPRIRELYRLALQDERELEVVGEAENGEDALTRARQTQPDLIVLDLSMPRRDGLQALQDIRRAMPGVRILVLSGFQRARIEPLALDMGANAYLEKGAPANELAAHMLRVAREPARPAQRVFTATEIERRVAQLV